MPEPWERLFYIPELEYRAVSRPFALTLLHFFFTSSSLPPLWPLTRSQPWPYPRIAAQITPSWGPGRIFLASTAAWCHGSAYGACMRHQSSSNHPSRGPAPRPLPETALGAVPGRGLFDQQLRPDDADRFVSDRTLDEQTAFIDLRLWATRPLLFRYSGYLRARRLREQVHPDNRPPYLWMYLLPWGYELAPQGWL